MEGSCHKFGLWKLESFSCRARTLSVSLVLYTHHSLGFDSYRSILKVNCGSECLGQGHDCYVSAVPRGPTTSTNDFETNVFQNYFQHLNLEKKSLFFFFWYFFPMSKINIISDISDMLNLWLNAFLFVPSYQTHTSWCTYTRAKLHPTKKYISIENIKPSLHPCTEITYENWAVCLFYPDMIITIYLITITDPSIILNLLSSSCFCFDNCS